MASKGAGMSFSRKSYRLTSDTEKSRVTGKGWQGGGWGGGVLFVLGEGEGRTNEPGPVKLPLVPVTGSSPAPVELYPCVVALLTLVAGQRPQGHPVGGNSRDQELD